MTTRGAALSWQPPGEADLPAVTELAATCLAADGGLPGAASPGFLSRSYLSGARTSAGWAGDRLICLSALRRAPAGAIGGAGPAVAVTTGLVHPAWRRRGIGGRAFDWAADRCGPGRLRAESEALSDGAHALYLSRGLSQVFAEDIMQLAAAVQLPPAAGPDGLVMAPWGQADPARFYAVYAAAFRERPGFSGWPAARWIDWISDDDDFRPQMALLATLDGTDVAFIVADAAGWIAQLGVLPAARGQGLGARLITEAVQLMRSAGETAITLDVNVDNPRAIALYRRLGFTRTGRRAKYQTPA